MEVVTMAVLISEGTAHTEAMPAVIAIILLVLPLAELAVILQIAGYLGLAQTLILLVAVSVMGAFLLKREGVATWRRLQDTLRQGRMPTSEVTDGALILFGGALLLTPGFLTDVVGLMMLVPGPRAVVKRWLGRAFGIAVMRHPAGRAGVVSSRVIRARRRRGPTTDAQAGPGTGPIDPPGPGLPPGAAGPDGDGSPGRG
jgi:UPF0716 protein FxsA